MTGIGSSCGACKFLRRKCTTGCIFAPYFRYDQAANHFAAVHKVFGASNASKHLSHLPLQNRSVAAFTMSYEALARMNDPVYGCVSHIFALQQQVVRLQEQIELLGLQMANSGVSVEASGSQQGSSSSKSQFNQQVSSMNMTYSENQQYEVLNNMISTHPFDTQMMNEQFAEQSNFDRFRADPEISGNYPRWEMECNNSMYMEDFILDQVQIFHSGR